LAQGEALLREVGDKVQLGLLMCTRGHCELLAGDGSAARATLAEAVLLAEAAGVALESGLGRKIARLREELPVSLKGNHRCSQTDSGG
jgi:hypothetical protein